MNKMQRIYQFELIKFFYSHTFTVLRDEFRTQPVNSVAVTGDVVVLECDPPRGYPPPTVKWMKDEMMVEPDDRTQLLDDGNLMISEVGYIYLSVCQSVWHSVCLSFSLSIRQPVTLCLCLQDQLF